MRSRTSFSPRVPSRRGIRARASRCYRNKAAGFDGPDFINFVVELPVAGNPALLKGELESARPSAVAGVMRRSGSRAHGSGHPAVRRTCATDARTGVAKIRPVALGTMLGPLAELAPRLVHPAAGVTAEVLWQHFDRAANPLTPLEIDLNGSRTRYSGTSSFPELLWQWLFQHQFVGAIFVQRRTMLRRSNKCQGCHRNY